MHKSFISRVLRIEMYEVVPALLSGLYYFCVLCAYYLIRPLRDERGIAGGADNLPWVMWLTLAATLIATPIFGWLIRGRARQSFIPTTYRFFALTFLVYAGANAMVSKDAGIALGVGFYVWVSVFNLFANSLMWAFMADGFKFEQSKRIFALIAIGGTIGALSGSAIARFVVEHASTVWRKFYPESTLDMGVLAAVGGCVLLLECACQLVRVLAPRFEALRARRDGHAPEADSRPSEPPVERSAGVWRGLIVTCRSPYLIAAAGYIFFYTVTSTLFYFQQGYLVEAAFETSAARREYFATVDLWVNGLTLLGQLFLTARLMSSLGVALTLAVLPAITLVGFLVIGADPTLTPFVIVFVLRRAGNFAISRPARETLFTVIPRAAKYQSKTFIDTFVYRAGDAIASPLDLLLRFLGLGISGVSYAAAPIAVIWLGLSVYLGRRQKALALMDPDQRAAAVSAH